MDIQVLLHMQKIFYSNKSTLSMLLHRVRVRLQGDQVSFFFKEENKTVGLMLLSALHLVFHFIWFKSRQG